MTPLWVARFRPDRFLEWWQQTYPPDLVVGTKADGGVRRFSDQPASIRNLTFTTELAAFRAQAQASVHGFPRWFQPWVLAWRYGYGAMGR